MDLVPDSWDFADDAEKDFSIVRALRAAIKAKPRCHNFNDNAVTYTKTTETKTTEIEAAEVNAARNMSRIGADRNNGKASCNQYKQRERN